MRYNETMHYNPWHGCHKYSAGCANCYVYRIDERVGRDASIVTKTQEFDLPLRRKRDGTYKVPGGALLYTCFSSDFFVEDADAWRPEVWTMMRERPDVSFFIITKRIVRFDECLPPDWGEGYPNVTIACTVENQEQAEIRLPVYKQAKIRHKQIICEPLLGPIDLSPYLDVSIELVLAGGESGTQARICDYAWVLELRRQAIEHDIPFYFKQTGARLRKNGKIYLIPRKFQSAQAHKANIDTVTKPEET